MGNSKSNTPKTKNENIPIKPTIKKTRVAGPVNGYDYYPAPYTLEQDAYPIYPANKTKNENIPIKPMIKKTRVAGPVNGYDYYPAPYTSEQYAYPIYPVVSSEKHLQNEFFPQLRAENKVFSPSISTYHHSHAHHSHRHHHPHASHDHRHHHPPTSHDHRHHHHHHQPTPSPETRRLTPATFQERATSPRPPSSSVQVQKPVSSAVMYKIASPVANNEVIASPLPSIHHSPSVSTKKPSFPVAGKQYQFFQPTIPERISPLLLVVSDSFERAPIMEINYVPQSPGSHSIHNYGPGTMSVVRHDSLQNTTPRNRWYDHDYDKRIKSLIINDV